MATDSTTINPGNAGALKLAVAPATTLAMLYEGIGQALANAAHNAVNAQQQASVTAQAATTMGISTLYSLDSAVVGAAVKEILGR